MNDQGSAGWLFAHPDLHESGPGGLQLSNRGGVERVRSDALVRQAILLLLSTRRGERVMRPAFGCELDRLVFLPNDVTTAGLAIHYVRQALERWEPRVEILRLDATPHPEDAFRLEIALDYVVVESGSEQTLSLSIDLAGESD
ncbi:MAG: GPW/gp25 family protein [Acidobacteriota bacterium]